MSAASDFRAIKEEAEKKKTETAAVAAVQRGLAATGFRKTPRVQAARAEGGVVRVYLWEGTPVGDVVLSAGPSYLPTVQLRSSMPGAPADGAFAIDAHPTAVNAKLKARLAREAQIGAAIATEAGAPPPTTRPTRKRKPAAPPRDTRSPTYDRRHTSPVRPARHTVQVTGRGAPAPAPSGGGGVDAAIMAALAKLAG